MPELRKAGGLIVFTIIWLTCCTTKILSQVRPPIAPINLRYLRIDFIHPSARPASLGGAFIAAAQDESAAPINPAGLTFLKSAGATLTQRQIRNKFDEPDGLAENPTKRKEFQSVHFDQTMVSVFMPFKRIKVAGFRNVVFDSRFNFQTKQFTTLKPPLTQRQLLGGLGNFPGRKVNLDLALINHGFSIAFKLHRKLSFGLTAKTSQINFRLNEVTYLDPQIAQGLPPRENTPETTYSIVNFDQRNTQPAYTIGLLGKLLRDQLFVGFVYNFNPSFEMESSAFLPRYDLQETSFSASAGEDVAFRLTVPDRYGLGLYYVATSKLRFTMDIVRVQYSDLLYRNDLNAIEDDIYDENLQKYIDPDGKEDLTVADATEFHFGLEYLFRFPQFGVVPLRLGFNTNPGHRIHAAVENEALQTLYPKAEFSKRLTLGLGVILNSYLKFDAGMTVSPDEFEVFASTLLSVPF